jgi:hypothetical protein
MPAARTSGRRTMTALLLLTAHLLMGWHWRTHCRVKMFHTHRSQEPVLARRHELQAEDRAEVNDERQKKDVIRRSYVEIIRRRRTS